MSLGFLLLLQLLAPGPVVANSILAEAGNLRADGRYIAALELLESATQVDPGAGQGDPDWQREMGLVFRGLGNSHAALDSSRLALQLAKSQQRDDLLAPLHSDIGVLEAEKGDFQRASNSFERALEAADDDALKSVTITINQARVALAMRDSSALQGHLKQAEELLSQQQYSSHLTTSRLAIGQLYREGQRQLLQPSAWRLSAFHQFSAALSEAQESGDRSTESWAAGYIGGLYQDELRYQDSLDYSRQAAYLAQARGMNEALYVWMWQIARALNELGKIDESLVAYRQSIDSLDQMKPDLALGFGASFRERAAPVFFEYADVLLTRTAQLQDAQQKEDNLREVRSTLEEIKVAEVQDYFEDQCMATDEGTTQLDLVGGSAAVIYPIMLPDRLELLVSLPGSMQQFTVPVSAVELTEEVRQFRGRIETYGGQTAFMPHAQRLHSWLVAPIEPALEISGVDTLVIVPDGPLRTIPLSALHDGSGFLIERYALATTPGLTLTSPQPLQRDEVELLAGGLTQSVQGFSALPNVAGELESISAEFPARTIRDQEFLVDEVEREIAEGDQEIVHIATHGQFDSDHTKSFLLAYDDKLTMDRLQSTIAERQFQEEPLELLVLSACQTAAGDDRAALGLAGVALKAGARSALASLWFVNDESTARMVADFYRQLGDASNSKAEALRLAQIELIRDSRFSHPSYWAPFLLIGNWL